MVPLMPSFASSSVPLTPFVAAHGQQRLAQGGGIIERGEAIERGDADGSIVDGRRGCHAQPFSGRRPPVPERGARYEEAAFLAIRQTDWLEARLLLAGNRLGSGHSLSFPERLQIGEQIGDIAVFEYEDRHFHRMADLDTTLERRLHRPSRQAVGGTAQAGGVRTGGNTVIKRVATGAVCLCKGPAFGCAVGESLRIAIGCASRDQERSCKNEQMFEHDTAPFPTKAV